MVFPIRPRQTQVLLEWHRMSNYYLLFLGRENGFCGLYLWKNLRPSQFSVCYSNRAPHTKILAQMRLHDWSNNYKASEWYKVYNLFSIPLKEFKSQSQETVQHCSCALNLPSLTLDKEEHFCRTERRHLDHSWASRWHSLTSQSPVYKINIKRLFAYKEYRDLQVIKKKTFLMNHNEWHCHISRIPSWSSKIKWMNKLGIDNFLHSLTFTNILRNEKAKKIISYLSIMSGGPFKIIL